MREPFIIAAAPGGRKAFRRPNKQKNLWILAS